MSDEYILLTKHDNRYHGIEKGCPVVKKRREMLPNAHYIEIYYCPVHNKEVSRSGWEWGWFKGQPNNPQTEALARLECK